MRPVTPIVLAATLIAGAAHADRVSFSNGWANQKLSLFSANSYSFGSSLGVQSNGTVSIAWTRLPRGEWDSTAASWSWSVDQSVPSTNLRNKGGDDRNLSLYFVFLPESEAERLEGVGIRRLLGNNSVRVLQYVWGGSEPRGAIFPSPYQPSQGANVALRQAGTGSFNESVNLARDYSAAFGGTPGQLVGLAVSGDSDDTDTVIRGSVSGLTLR